MCVNYRPPDRDVLDQGMGLKFVVDAIWKAETWKDYLAPIVRRGADGKREGLLASYGMVPVKRMPAGIRFDSMNARSETVGEKRTFKSAWQKSHLCLVPMTAFFEPCYESGKPVRWGIGMADQSMFAVAGLWKEWEYDSGMEYSFTQLTINADEHPLMKRFHKPGDEKRALVIVPRDGWDDWLNCQNPEFARAFLQHFPVDLMTSWAFPVPPRKKKDESVLPD